MKRRRFLIAFGAVVFIIFCVVVGCDLAVSINSRGRTYDVVDSVPHRKVGLVLGTSPISTWTGRHNRYFDYRIHAAADLYKAGKVDWLVVSGGDYRNSETRGYDEPVAMRDSLVALGVDSARIVLDYDGTRTLNSLAKIKDVYDTDSIILISQGYHNERALYQADYLGVDAIAFNAKTPGHRRSWLRNRGRECLARVKLFVDILRRVNPDIKESMQRKLESESSPLLSFSDISTPHGDLLCIVPSMGKLSLDLVCGTVPDATNDSIALAFAGAFTGTMWDKGHGNVAGDHVASGVRYSGYRCKRNTGAFTWSATSGPQFHYKDYDEALTQAAREGGMGFAQEMMIHGGKSVETTRPLGNRNQFRALCLDGEGRLAIYESRGIVSFGNFISSLLDAGVTEALYTDMGPGWNYCFYRQQQGQPASFLHDLPESRASNFLLLKLRACSLIFVNAEAVSR